MFVAVAGITLYLSLQLSSKIERVEDIELAFAESSVFRGKPVFIPG